MKIYKEGQYTVIDFVDDILITKNNIGINVGKGVEFIDIRNSSNLGLARNGRRYRYVKSTFRAWWFVTKFIYKKFIEDIWK